MDPILAAIYMFTGNYAPVNFMLCFGQFLSIGQYSALFSILGVQYGGNGTTNFALPNMQGRIPVGSGLNPAQGYDYAVGASVDNYTAVQLSVANMPAHTHAAQASAGYNGQPSYIAAGAVSGTCDWTVPAAATTADTLAPSATTVLAQGLTAVGTTNRDTKMYVDNPTSTVQMTGGSGDVTGGTTVQVVAPQVTVSNGATGGGALFSIQPSYCTVNFILCSNGLYPVRP